jgi:hypothetical protein
MMVKDKYNIIYLPQEIERAKMLAMSIEYRQMDDMSRADLVRICKEHEVVELIAGQPVLEYMTQTLEGRTRHELIMTALSFNNLLKTLKPAA